VCVRALSRFECEFSGVDEGLRLNAAVSETVVASTTFLNCGKSIVNGEPVTDGGGGGTGVINCAVTIGQRTEWALPSGDSLFVEGTRVITGGGGGGGHNGSATVFDPSGAGSMTLMHNTFETDIPLGVSTPIACDNVTCPIPWLAPTLPSDAAQWILVNNKASAGGDRWSHAAAVVLGPSSHTAGAEAARVVVLSDGATSLHPQSQLLFGGEW
jgi:hypothetical protein